MTLYNFDSQRAKKQQTAKFNLNFLHHNIESVESVIQKAFEATRKLLMVSRFFSSFLL